MFRFVTLFFVINLGCSASFEDIEIFQSHILVEDNNCNGTACGYAPNTQSAAVAINVSLVVPSLLEFKNENELTFNFLHAGHCLHKWHWVLYRGNTQYCFEHCERTSWCAFYAWSSSTKKCFLWTGDEPCYAKPQDGYITYQRHTDTEVFSPHFINNHGVKACEYRKSKYAQPAKIINSFRSSGRLHCWRNCKGNWYKLNGRWKKPPADDASRRCGFYTYRSSNRWCITYKEAEGCKRGRHVSSAITYKRVSSAAPVPPARTTTTTTQLLVQQETRSLEEQKRIQQEWAEQAVAFRAAQAAHDATSTTTTTTTTTTKAPRYTFVAAGIAGPEKWLGGAGGKGVQACFEAVFANPECAHDYFTYVARGDTSCGCKVNGSLGIRYDNYGPGHHAKSDYYALVKPPQVTNGAYGSAPAGTPCIFPFTNRLTNETHHTCAGTGHGGYGYCSVGNDMWGGCKKPGLPGSYIYENELAATTYGKVDGSAGYVDRDVFTQVKLKLDELKHKEFANLETREGLLYDLTSKISAMCTVSETDTPATKKNKETICSKVPLIMLGIYTGAEITDTKAAWAEDSEDIGCADLPVMASQSYFIFGINLPEIEAISFGGGNLCYAQLMHEGKMQVGTAMLLFAPKLFVDNPIVQGLLPGVGVALKAASAVVSHIAVGVSFPIGPGQTSKMEMSFSNPLWRCDGCKSVQGHVYFSTKLDITENVGKKIKIGPLSMAIEAKCMIDFDPLKNGFLNKVHLPILSGLVNGGQSGSGINNILKPDEALEFLTQVLTTDFAVGIDGKLILTLPLGDWSGGLFRDLDINVGAASALFKKTGLDVGVFVSMKSGGLANNGFMADIQRKILEKFQTPAVKAVIGFLGKGIGAVVDAMLSTGQALDLYYKVSCGVDLVCSMPSFGLKFKADLFEAHIELTKTGEFVFCFAIKGIYDSCGNGVENILVLFERAGEMILNVGEEIGEAIEAGYTAAVKEVVQLQQKALKDGQLVVDSIGEGFENAVTSTGKSLLGAGSDTIVFAGEALEKCTEVSDVCDGISGAGDAIVGAIKDPEGTGDAILGAAESFIANLR